MWGIYGLMTKRKVMMAGHSTNRSLVFLWAEKQSWSIKHEKEKEANIQPPVIHLRIGYVDFFYGNTTDNFKQARSSRLAHSGSQSQLWESVEILIRAISRHKCDHG